MAEPFLGQIMIFGGNFAPSGWAFCEGQVLPVSANAALYSLLGVMYGGNGTTNFMLPDLRGRMPIGMGQGNGFPNYTQGQTAGSLSATLTQMQLPTHTHAATFTPTGSGGSTTPPVVTVSIQAGNGLAPATQVVGPPYLAGSVPDPTGGGGAPTNLYASSPGSGTVRNLAGVSATVSGGSISGGGTVTNALAGANQPFSIQNPYIAVNYIIALQGIYPVRG